jgi:hypothetical protein
MNTATLVTFEDHLLYLARAFGCVREAQHLGQNKGARVEAIQRWSLGQPGDSWCAEWATMILDLAFQGKSPVPRSQACEDVHAIALVNHWITDSPSVGDLVLSVTPEGHAHHIAIVTATNPLTAIAGNTSSDGTSSNGDGVYEHPINPAGKVFVKYPR